MTYDPESGMENAVGTNKRPPIYSEARAIHGTLPFGLLDHKRKALLIKAKLFS